MKKFTKLATAASLVLFAGSASAAFTASEIFDGEIGLGGPTPTTSSVLFAAYNADSASANFGRTFLFDLALDGHNNLVYADFVNGTAGNLSWNLNNFSQFTSYKAPLAAGKLNWVVLGGSQLDELSETPTNQDKTSPSFNAPAQWGVIFTARGDLSKVKAGEYEVVKNEAGNTGSIGVAIVKANNSLLDLGLTENIADTPASGNGAYADITGIGGLAAPGADAPIIRGVGDADFVYVTNPAFSGANVLSQLGTFHLSATNILTYTPFTAAVPLPAGVWFFMSGLLGLLGLNRRKSLAV